MGIIRVVRNGAAVIGLGAAAGAAYITVRHVLNTPQPLTSGLPGEARIDRRHGGDLYYNVAGPVAGTPLVLLHDFYPGASNFEYRDIFSALADRFRVFAPDWLGFGMSEHPNIAYTGEFYAHVLTGFLRDVVAQPAIVVAHGRAANVAVRAASDAPGLIVRLVLIAPEGEAGLRESPTLSQTVLRLTQRAMLGLIPYALLSTMPALRWFSRGVVGPEAESEDLHHRYASAHQFGGHYAPLALLTGELDLPMRHVFPLLEQPSLIICGEDDPHHPPEEMEDLAILNPRADLDVLPGVGVAVLKESPSDVLHLIDVWLKASTLEPPPPGRSGPEVLDTPSVPDTSGDVAMESPGKAATGPLEPDIPEVPVVTDVTGTSAASETMPKLQDPIQDPREERPTTRAAHRADPTSMSTRVRLPADTSGSSRPQGAARSKSRGNTARKRSSRPNGSNGSNGSGESTRE